MSFNQVVRFLTGQTTLNAGEVVAGQTDLTAESSTGACGVCVDYSGNIFITDEVQHIVLKLDNSGNISTYAGVAGTAGNNGSNTVTAYVANFNNPQGICCDKSGNLYVADTGNNQIRKIDPNRNVSLVAGSPSGNSGYSDGANLSALFDEPHDIAVDASGNLYVADGSNHAVRKINGATTSTIAGNGTPGDATGGVVTITGTDINGDTLVTVTPALLNTPLGVTVNRSGSVFIADAGNHRIKVVLPDGRCFNYSGNGTSGTTISNAANSEYQQPRMMDCDRSGNLYVVDWSGGTSSRLLSIDANGNPGVIIDFSGGSAYAYVIGVAVDQSGALYVTESVADLQMSSSSSSSSSTGLAVSSSSSSSSRSSQSLSSSSSSSSLSQ